MWAISQAAGDALGETDQRRVDTSPLAAERIFQEYRKYKPDLAEKSP
jgi:hypothetical protein